MTQHIHFIAIGGAAMQADVDMAILSNMEHGEKKFSKEFVLKLSERYKVNSDKLTIDFLSEKGLNELEDEDYEIGTLKIEEKQIK